MLLKGICINQSYFKVISTSWNFWSHKPTNSCLTQDWIRFLSLANHESPNSLTQLYQELHLEVTTNKTQAKYLYIKCTWVILFGGHNMLSSPKAKKWRLQCNCSCEGNLIWANIFPNQLKTVVCGSHFQPILYFPLVLPIIYSRQLRNMQDTRRRHRKKWLRPYLLSPKQAPFFSHFSYGVCLLMQVYQSLLSNLGTVLRNGKPPSFLYILYSIHTWASFFFFCQ